MADDETTGKWVAKRDIPHPDQTDKRLISYLKEYDQTGSTWIVDPADGLRFDTKEEASAALSEAPTPIHPDWHHEPARYADETEPEGEVEA